MTDPETRLLFEDMLKDSRVAARIVSERIAADFADDEMAFLAASRAVEIACEAAYQVAEARRAEFPLIPWRQIIATRHKYVHGYRTVLASILHDTVSKKFPPLIAELERIIE